MNLNDIKKIIESKEEYNFDKEVEKFYLKGYKKIILLFLVPAIIPFVIIFLLLTGNRIDDIIKAVKILLESDQFIFLFLVFIFLFLFFICLAFLPVITLNFEKKEVKTLLKKRIPFDEIENLFIVKKKEKLILILMKEKVGYSILLNDLDNPEKLLFLLKKEFGDKLKIKE